MTNKTQNKVLIIGASGGIGEALVNKAKADNWQVVALSRSARSSTKADHWYTLDTGNEEEIAEFTANCQRDKLDFDRIICAVGTLHDDSVKPEKRLEDISQSALLHYMKVNVTIPALWLKYAPKLLSKQSPTSVTVLSARVGSISDNELGGWYGYRASKSALNMLVKTAQIEYQRRLKNTAIITYHPGTVDTALSKPFQANVKPEKLFTAEFTAERLWRELDNKPAENAPYYIDWQGKTIPW